MVTQILDNQVLVWLGSVYAPLLPIFGLLSNVTTFYTKKFLSLHLYTPPKERYSASRTNVIIYSCLLGVSHPSCLAWVAASAYKILVRIGYMWVMLVLCEELPLQRPQTVALTHFTECFVASPYTCLRNI